MRATAVPDDHLMRSKFHIAHHVGYSDEIRRNRTKLPLACFRYAETNGRGRMESKSDKCKFDAEEALVQAAKLKLPASQLANFGLRPYKGYESSSQLRYSLRRDRVDIL
jgi:hypothetical protein